MSINGRRDGFASADLLALAATARIKPARAREMLDQVKEAVKRWPVFAAEAGVSDVLASEIQRNLTLLVTSNEP